MSLVLRRHKRWGVLREWLIALRVPMMVWLVAAAGELISLSHRTRSLWCWCRRVSFWGAGGHMHINRVIPIINMSCQYRPLGRLKLCSTRCQRTTPSLWRRIRTRLAIITIFQALAPTTLWKEAIIKFSRIVTMQFRHQEMAIKGNGTRTSIWARQVGTLCTILHQGRQRNFLVEFRDTLTHWNLTTNCILNKLR